MYMLFFFNRFSLQNLGSPFHFGKNSVDFKSGGHGEA